MAQQLDVEKPPPDLSTRERNLEFSRVVYIPRAVPRTATHASFHGFMRSFLGKCITRSLRNPGCVPQIYLIWSNIPTLPVRLGAVLIILARAIVIRTEHKS
jgi:hypothetical protein